jgi:hypothetical protein
MPVGCNLYTFRQQLGQRAHCICIRGCVILLVQGALRLCWFRFDVKFKQLTVCLGIRALKTDCTCLGQQLYRTGTMRVTRHVRTRWRLHCCLTTLKFNECNLHSSTQVCAVTASTKAPATPHAPLSTGCVCAQHHDHPFSQQQHSF